MSKFLDGPAAGKSLDLSRAPVFLRVVIDSQGAVDALDKLDDLAKPNERIYVYRCVGEVSSGFACTRGKGCRPFVSAEYRLHERQPDDAQARDNASWSEWAYSEFLQDAPVVTEGPKP